MSYKAFGLALALALATTPLSAATQQDGDRAPAPPSYREKLAGEAEAVKGLAETPLGIAFLEQCAALPPMTPRKFYYRQSDRSALSPAAHAALEEADASTYQELDVQERHYFGLYSTPIACIRAIDIASHSGLTDVEGKRIADFGFGNIGQLVALSALGAHPVGIEIAGGLQEAIYHPEAANPLADGNEDDPQEPSARIQLVFGRYPTTQAIIDEVGAEFDLFISKNTLKKGYIHPEREAPPSQLIDLGVDDRTYLTTVYEALAPGGMMLIYNLYPKPAADDEPYIPWASGECPFEKPLVEDIGFEIIAWNTDDSAKARAMGKALNWDSGVEEEAFNDNLYAMYTVLRKPRADVETP